METNLKNQRRDLAETVYNLYSPDNFPGSRAWIECNNARKELAAFDAAHPEIIAQIKDDQAAKSRQVADDAGWI